MFLGYNTNGLAHHDLFDAVVLLADAGYRGVAITVDHGALPPHGADNRQRVDGLRRMLAEHQMRSVIETGARFLLNPKRKHEPTLVSIDASARDRRARFYRHAIDCAADLGSDCVSIWSGVVQDDASRDEAMGRLVEGLQKVLEYAVERGVPIAFEPEPGMLIDSMVRYAELIDRLDSPQLKLTLDIGHLHCQGETPVADYIVRWSDRLVNVHLEDMRAGIHEHLMFGDGEIDFPPVIRALAEIGYQGGLYVELSRHSHQALTAVRRAFDFLSPMILEV
jgi:L-ribulose-5-phosphate 3-epimerase